MRQSMRTTMRDCLLKLLSLEETKFIPDAEILGVLMTTSTLISYHVGQLEDCESMKEIQSIFGVSEHASRLMYAFCHQN